HWRERLRGAPAVLDLPSDRPRPMLRSGAGGTLSTTVPAELAGRLRELAAATETTLFMVLLAAYQVLLHRYGGGDDIVLGVPVAGRGRDALAGPSAPFL